VRRRAFRKVRAYQQSEQHQHGYAVLLAPAATGVCTVHAANLKHDVKKPCVYVGTTGLSPEERFPNHKQRI
jgi:hypothetical protein